MKKHLDVIAIVAAIALAFYLAPTKSAFQEKDIEAAIPKAVQGDVKAQSFLAECYYFGIGAEPNGREFLKWAYKAARQNDGWALVMLAWFYQNNLHRTEDAVGFARKSAATGHPRGQRYMGFISHYGIGVPQDDVEAVKWWKLAAAQDDDGAEESLGQAYAHGLGVKQDYAQASYWFGLAAKHGSTFDKAESVFYYFMAVDKDIDSIGEKKPAKPIPF